MSEAQQTNWLSRPVLRSVALSASLVMSASVVGQEASCDQIKPTELSRWFRGGIAGKTVAFLGDSTTSNAFALFRELRDFYSREGQALYGIGPILNYGENGASLRAFLQNNVTYGLSASIAAKADLYILSYGINDVRLGQTTEDTLVAMLAYTVNRISSQVPEADIVLRMPNSFLASDVNALGFVKPKEHAPKYSTVLRNAYKRLENKWPNVLVLDSQELVFGRGSPVSSARMADQIHPSAEGYAALAEAIVNLIGEHPAIDKAKIENAVAANPNNPHLVYPEAVKDPRLYNLVATGRWISSSGVRAENGFVDFTWPANKADDIQCGDVLQHSGSHLLTLPSFCLVVGLGTYTRIYNLGNALNEIEIAGGSVSVFRRKR